MKEKILVVDDDKSMVNSFHRVSWCRDCDIAFTDDLPAVYADLSEKEKVIYIQNLCF